jgi:glycosyltransferase involved in cell wall biosynthesis
LYDPVVSVVLPYRNAALTIDECLQSIREQSFGDFELLAINDHSCDTTEQRVKLYQQQDDRLRCLSAPHKGLVAALNFGIDNARGTYIARMDADDRMWPDRLRQQVCALDSNRDWSLVASQVRLFPENLVKAGYREYIRWQNQCLTPADIEADIYRESPFAHPSVTFRKTEVVELGGYRDGDFPEDYDLWLRMFQSGLRMAKLPEVLLDWRESPGRLSRTDPRYAQREFDRLRAHYLAMDPRLQTDRSIVIWGAGRKTRLRCRPLLEKGFLPAAWIDIDPAKIGNIILHAPVMAPDWLQQQEPKPLVLIYVRNHGAHEEIAAFLENSAYRRGRDYLFIG